MMSTHKLLPGINSKNVFLIICPSNTNLVTSVWKVTTNIHPIIHRPPLNIYSEGLIKRN